MRAVEVCALRKAFGDKTVLDGIDLQVDAGVVFALLGPNGAGKTTAVQILSTLMPADSGSVRIAGIDPTLDADGVRRAIGVTGQFSAVDNLLTGEENLLLMADLHRLDRARGRLVTAALLDRFELTGEARQVAATYSGGMRRRLDLAMSLVGEPLVVFLDEPTTGLDPRSRRTMWQIVRELAAAGVTIFLTTQNLDEADRLADRIAVLDHGRLVAEGSPQELRRVVPGGHIRLFFSDRDELARASGALPEALRDEESLELRVPTDNTPASLTALLARVDRERLGVERLVVQTRDLDDVFFALTRDDDPTRSAA